MRVHARREEGGQASVELVAVVPFVLLVGAIVWQLVVAGHALWVCSNAARVGARAAVVGDDVERAVRSALPDSLERDLRVEPDDGEGRVAVEVRLPLLAGAFGAIPVRSAARLSEAATP